MIFGDEKVAKVATLKKQEKCDGIQCEYKNKKVGKIAFCCYILICVFKPIHL